MGECATASRTTSKRRGLNSLPSRTLASTMTKLPGSCRRRACVSLLTPSIRCFKVLQASRKPSRGEELLLIESQDASPKGERDDRSRPNPPVSRNEQETGTSERKVRERMNTENER